MAKKYEDIFMNLLERKAVIDKKKQPNKTMLVVFIAGLTALLCIRDILFISLSKWILVALLSFAVGVPYETLIYMLCFMFPLFCGIPRKYILLMFLISSFGKEKEKLTVV